MSLVARNIIELNGWDTNWVFNGLSLRQVYNDHHVFEISVLVPPPAKGQASAPALTQAALTGLLGQDIALTIRSESAAGKPGEKRAAPSKAKTGAVCHFKGFVDQVVPVWTSRSCTLRIIGYGKTIFMDCGPRFRTFYQKPAGEIVRKITHAYGTKIPPLEPGNAGIQVGFSVQTQETDYRYLCRLADACGKVFYFDGQQMHFGDLENNSGSASSIALEFGEDLKQANLSLNTAPLSFQLGAWHLEDSALKNSHPDRCTNVATLVSEVVQKSGVYPASKIHLFNLTGGESDLKDKAQRLVAKQAHDLVRLTGVSDVPSLTIGSRIEVIGSSELFGQGEFVIIEIHHTVKSDYSYSNTFKAVPAGYPFPIRMTNARSPLCGPLMAVVTDHDDPKKLGRVRVEFIGDEEKTRSPWLRVLTPYTGFGGMYYLPEPGDHVVVEAEDFNMEKSPFVSGAFYHGKADAAQWFDPKNKKKGFTTEKVSFKIDDHTGKLTIEAEDIEIVARRQIKTKGKEAHHAAQQRMTIDGARQLTLEADRIDLNP